MEIERTDFERTLSSLEGLTRKQIADLVLQRVSREDALTFHVLTEGLSLEALRFASARALLRTRGAPPPAARDFDGSTRPVRGSKP